MVTLTLKGLFGENLQWSKREIIVSIRLIAKGYLVLRQTSTVELFLQK